MTQYKLEEYIFPRKTDWEKVFQELKDNNVKPCQIAELIDMPGSSLQRILNGVEPRHSVGEAILKLHSRYCAERLD